MESLVSVIVPVYNAQDFLDRCIDSIVKQTYTNLEIILVDDGSLDKSCEMCDKWAQNDSRIKVIHQENSGAGYARNTGVQNSNGEYVCFVDSDDSLDVTAIKKCIDSIQKYGSDTALFGLSHINGESNERHNISKDKLFYDKEAVREELIASFFTLKLGFDVGVVCKLFSRKVITDNSLSFMSEREIYSEDALFLLEYFTKCTSVSVVPENLYSCYNNGASLSREYKKEREEKLDAFLHKSLQITGREKLSKTVDNHIMARYHGCCMVEFKTIAKSSLKFSEKQKLLKQHYNSSVLKSTLTKEVFAVEKWTLRLFYRLVKLRLYCMSYLLLKVKS